MTKCGLAEAVTCSHETEYCKKHDSAQYYLVPVYRNDVYNDDETLKEAPPNRAVQRGKSEEDWPVMDKGFRFRFSLYSLSLIEVTKSDGEVVLGYFRRLDRSDGFIKISVPQDLSQKPKKIGTTTLLSIKKFHVDRLGNYSSHEIQQETRTWRGKACI